jgi:hypothetical protein
LMIIMIIMMWWWWWWCSLSLSLYLSLSLNRDGYSIYLRPTAIGTSAYLGDYNNTN